jgi:hypothetical protein
MQLAINKAHFLKNNLSKIGSWIKKSHYIQPNEISNALLLLLNTNILPLWLGLLRF